MTDGDPIKVKARNVFEALPPKFDVKLNGRIVGTGVIGKDGAIEMDIEDEEAKRLLQNGSVGSLSIDPNSKTIQAIMKNRKNRGL